MKFLIDAQLPPLMAEWLREAGHAAEHVEAAGLRNAEDAAIWAYADKTGVVIVTKDEDFVALARSAAGRPVVVWLRIGNCANATLRAWLDSRLAGIVHLVNEGSRIIEVI